MFGKDKDPARIGLTAHTAILHKLVSMGLEVLQPLSDDLRYDLAEYFGVYCGELNKTYLVPVDLVPRATEMHLRVMPSKNNQVKKVIWARDYEI